MDRRDTGVGDPALDLRTVGGQHGQAVLAVDLKLAQGLSHGLVREKNLRVARVSHQPGQRGRAGTLAVARAGLPVWHGQWRAQSLHGLADLQVAERAPGCGPVDVDPAAQQLGGVDGAVVSAPMPSVMLQAMIFPAASTIRNHRT